MKWNDVKEENEALKEKASAVVGLQSEQKNRPKSERKDGDINSGLELLELEFVLGVIEETTSREQNDIIMRKIAFNEVLRRNSRHEVASSALKVYSKDEDGFYGKDIQCQAMQELAERTNK